MPQAKFCHASRHNMLVKFEGFSDVFEQKIKKNQPAAGFLVFLRKFTFNPILHFLFEILGIQGGMER